MPLTIEEESKHWTKQELRDFLIEYNKTMKRFDDFLKKELGETTYIDICKDFALQESKDWMKRAGMDDDDINEFSVMMGHGETSKS